MSVRRKIISDFFYYFFDMALVSLVGYAFYFLAGRILVPEEYGILMTIIGLYTVLSPMLSLGFNEALARFIPRVGKKESKTLLKYSIKKSLIFSIVVGFLFFVFSDFISTYIYSNLALSMYFKIFGVFLATGVIFVISKGYLQGLKDFKAMLIFDFFSQPIRIVSLLIFSSIIGGIFGWIICFILFSLFVYVGVWKSKTNKESIPKSFLKYGLLSAASLMGYWFFIQFPVIFLSFFSLKESGYFGVAVVFAQIILFFSLIFSGLVLPHLSEFYKKNETDKAKRLTKISMIQLLFISFVLFFVIYFSSGWIINKIYSQRYLPSIPYVTSFSFVSILFGINWFLLVIMYSKGFPEKRARYIWISNIIAVLLTIILFGYFYVEGMIFSFLISQMILLGLNMRYLIWG